MKLATMVLIGLPISGFLTPMNADDDAGAGQAVIAFTGGSTWNSDGVSGICKWYLPLVGNHGVTVSSSGVAAISPALFSDPQHPSNVTAHLVWVSPFKVAPLPAASPLTLFLAPAGTATIYYSATPSQAFWNDPASNGVAVATFVRKAGLVQSGDGLQSDGFIFSADLVSSRTFYLNGSPFNFRDLIPNGMTCFETGRIFSSSEVGTCIAIGGGR